MKTKPLTFLLVLTFLFLLSGSVYGVDLEDAWDAYKQQDYKTAHKLWLELAEQGDALAQGILGSMYANGQGVLQDYKEAIKWIRLSAEQGEAKAQNNLGLMYEKGQGVPQDDKEARKWYLLSAEQGKASAQNNLGGMYEKGQGVPQDYKEAVRLYRLSAEQGNAEAQYNLGRIHRRGQGVPQDYKEAVKWYRLSAEGEYAIAQYNLGWFYYHGQGVLQDYKEARKWWRLSAEQGYALAQYNLGGVYYEGKGVLQDDKEAVKWWKLAAEQGNSDAQNNLGVMYVNGQGVPQDYKEAAKLWLSLAKQGNAEAQYNLGLMYTKGQGVPQDYKEAVKWYRLSAEQGHAKAQNDLGGRYANGQGVPKNYKEAVKWYRLSAVKGDATAQYNLGGVYYEGKGVLQDYKEARKWWKLAAEQGNSNAKKRLGLFTKKNNINKLTSDRLFQQEEVKKKHWKNGNLKSEMHFKDSKLVMWKRYYYEGNLKYETHYKNGKREGLATTWDILGEKYIETHYKNGEKEGQRKVWWNTISLKYETHYKNGKKEKLPIWGNLRNLKSETNYKNGKKDGLEKGWYVSGIKKYETHYKNGEREGLDILFDESGKKSIETHYKNGKKDGLETEWTGTDRKKSLTHYKNGKKESWTETMLLGGKKSERHYKNGENVSWTIWYESGEKLLEVFYKNGKEEGLSKEWWNTGSLKIETPYKNGKKEGLVTVWYKNGEKKSTKHFKNGIENGIRTEWDEDGKKTFQGNFVDGAEEIIKTTEGLKGLKRNAEITGFWCGKPVDKQENCKGDEVGFLNLKQVGVGLAGDFCEAYQHDCAMIRGGEVSDKNVTFSILYDVPLRLNFNLRLLDDNYLKGTAFSSKCNCDLPISFFRINSEEASTNVPLKNLEQKTANEIEEKTDKDSIKRNANKIQTPKKPQAGTDNMLALGLDDFEDTDAIKNEDNEFDHHAVQGLVRVIRFGKFRGKEYERSFCGQYRMRIIRPNNIDGQSYDSEDQMKFDADTILAENPNLIELPTYGNGKLGSLNSIILFKKSTPLIGFNGFYIGLKCEDITSDGKPELFVDINDWGGMHTYIQYIFSMDEFNPLLDTRASGVTWSDGGLHQNMEDLDGDGVKEYNGWRSSFDLVGVCNACRQPPRVIMCLNDNEYVDCTKKFPELLQQDINESRKRLRSRTEYFKKNIDALHTELIFQIATSSNLNKEKETHDYIKTNFSKETVVRIMELLTPGPNG